MDPCSTLFRRFAFVLKRSWRQRVLDPARRPVGVTAGDVKRHVRSAKGAAEVGDIPLYFPAVEVLLTIRQIPLHRAGVDIVKRDPLENILRRISKHDNGGVPRFVDNLPVATEEPTRRQRNDAIAAVLPRKYVFQGL